MFFNFQKYYRFKIPKKAIFIDVGANKGEWSKKILKKYNQCFIYAVEPIKNITKINNKRIKLINLAVDIKIKKNVSFYITKKNVTSSLLAQNRTIIDQFKTFKSKNGLIHKRQDYDITKKIKTETITLKKLCEFNKIKSNSLFKN